jgi:hypothetical protein
MSFATILPGRSIRILVSRHLAPRRRAGVGGRGSVQRSRHRVPPLRRVSVPISLISVRVSVSVSTPTSVSVLSTVRLGSGCASSRAVRMGGLSVVILWSDFAVLHRKERKKETVVSQNRQVGGRSSHGGRTITSQFAAPALAFAQALEQKLCNTPEAGSNHLGCR